MRVLTEQPIQKRTRLGIVIPTRNRPDQLRRLIGSLQGQLSDGPNALNTRVIIVDDGNLGEFSNLPSGCLLLKSPRRGPAAARNYGASLLSDVDYLLFVDDDCILDANFVDMLMLTIEQTSADIIIPSIEPYGVTGEGLLGAYLVRRGFQLPYMDIQNGIACFPTAALAVRHPLFNAAGGFPEEITWAGGEDDVFGTKALRKGAQVHYSSQSVAFHENPATLGDLLKRWYRYGRGHAAAVALLGLTSEIYGLPALPASLYHSMKFLISRLRLFIHQARTRKEIPMHLRATYLLLDAVLEVSRQLGARSHRPGL